MPPLVQGRLVNLAEGEKGSQRLAVVLRAPFHISRLKTRQASHSSIISQALRAGLVPVALAGGEEVVEVELQVVVANVVDVVDSRQGVAALSAAEEGADGETGRRSVRIIGFILLHRVQVFSEYAYSRVISHYLPIMADVGRDRIPSFIQITVGS